MIEVRTAVTLACAAGLVFAGWTMRSWYDGSREAVRLAAEAKAKEELIAFGNDLARRTELAIGGIRVENRTIYNEVQKEILREPVYQSCRLPESGRVRLNEARRGGSGQPDGPMRTAPAAPR